jgi:hypothetical protein
MVRPTELATPTLTGPSVTKPSIELIVMPGNRYVCAV